MFYDRFKQLCDRKRVSIYKAATDIGLNRAAANKWKSGSIPNGQTLGKLAEYFGVTNDYLLGNDEDSRALEKAKTELTEYVKANPGALSGKRLDLLFNASGYDHVIVCFNLGIEQSYLDSWMNNNDLPPKPIVDKILGVFRLKPKDLLSGNELVEYCDEAQEWESKEIALAKSGKCSGGCNISDNSSIAFRGNPSSDLLTSEEFDLLRKYRALDDSGKGRVKNVLNYEYDALPGSEANSVPKEA